MSDYLNKIKKIVSEKTGIELSEISEDSFIGDDLNIGEMDLIEMLEEMEEVFQVNLVEKADSFETIQDIIDALEEKIQ
jgi:acyl carrier protein